MDFKGIKYSPQTGLMFKCYNGGRKPVQRIVGGKRKSVYLKVSYEGKQYPVQRMIWEIMTGNPPPGNMMVDHINGNPHDNRWSNLRLVDVRMNGQNRKEHRNGKLIGSCKKADNKYESYTMVNGKDVYIGSSKTELGAHYLYIEYMEKNNIPFLTEIDKRIPGYQPNNHLLKWNRVTVVLDGKEINLTKACRAMGVLYSSLKNMRKKHGWSNQELIDYYSSKFNFSWSNI